MSLLDSLPKYQNKPVSEPPGSQPSPVVYKEPDSPAPVVPPIREFCSYCGAGIGKHRRIGEGTCPKCDPQPNNKPSLKDMLKAKPLGVAATPVQPVLDSEPVSTVAVAPPNKKPSLADKLRQTVKEKAEQVKPLVTKKAYPVTSTTPASVLKSDTPEKEPDAEVSYNGSSLSLQDKIALAKNKDIEIDTAFEPSILSPESDMLNLLDRYGRPITLNEKQASGCQMAINGQDFVLTGEAGTGKSTTIEAVLASLLHFHEDKITGTDYRMQDRSGRRISGPSVCVCAYTRKAIGNVARILSHNFELYAEMEGALQTVHNLLEYSPVMLWSEKQEREVQMFKPQRGQWNPLAITHLIIEEASMLGLDLWEELRAALNPGVQIIYVGDINQLPPVFGKSVMSYALTKLPIVHLDIVYRQALDNPIIANAHAVLHGNPIKETKPEVKWMTGNSKTAQPEETMSRAMGTFFGNAIENRRRVIKWRKAIVDYEALTLEERKTTPNPKTEKEIDKLEQEAWIFNPDEDIVLIPFNKNAMGTRIINYRIAQILGEERNAEVFEIIAGYEKHYLAVGDNVLVNKMEGKIVHIRSNMSYMGKKPMSPSVNLSRFGFYIGKAADSAAAVMNGEDLDLSNMELDVLSDIDENEERKQLASHIVSVELETGQEITVSSAGEFNGQIFQLGYALSVHKAQGSEWRRVFLLFHKNHSTMLSRELLYTAMTRAREELVIIARPELIRKAITSPRIKGNSLKEKVEYFNSGYLDEDVEVSV